MPRAKRTGLEPTWRLGRQPIRAYQAAMGFGFTVQLLAI